MYRMVLGLVVVSFIAIGCSQQSQEQASVQETSAAVQQQAQGVVAQVQEVAQQGTEVAAKVQEDAQNAAGAVVDQAKTLLANAQDMIANGKFEEAIAAAQKVLSIDPNNIDAKNIIETAKAKISEMAQQKAGEIKDNVNNALNSLGN